MTAESKIPHLKYRFENLAFKYILKSLSFTYRDVILSFQNLRKTVDDPIYEGNFEKSLLVRCF